MEGEGLLADAGVDVPDDAEVRMVGVPVVHTCDVQFPVGHHYQLQSCENKNVPEFFSKNYYI